MKIIVTGGNSGGRATASAMSTAGHHVLIACRLSNRRRETASEMTGNIEVRELDLADLNNLRRLSDTVDSVDVPVNNASALRLPITRTVNGFEVHIGVNHHGHFALTCPLGERIHDGVVSVSSTNYTTARLHLDDLGVHR